MTRVNILQSPVQASTRPLSDQMDTAEETVDNADIATQATQKDELEADSQAPSARVSRSYKDDEIMVDLMLDAVRTGKAGDTVFKAVTWNEVSAQCNCRVGREGAIKTVKSARSRYQHVSLTSSLRCCLLSMLTSLTFEAYKKLQLIKSFYDPLLELLSTSGAGVDWDDETGTVTLPDDAWDNIRNSVGSSPFQLMQFC